MHLTACCDVLLPLSGQNVCKRIISLLMQHESCKSSREHVLLRVTLHQQYYGHKDRLEKSVMSFHSQYLGTLSGAYAGSSITVCAQLPNVCVHEREIEKKKRQSVCVFLFVTLQYVCMGVCT